MLRLILLVALLTALIPTCILEAQETPKDSRLLTAEQIYRPDGPAKALPKFERCFRTLFLRCRPKAAI